MTIGLERLSLNQATVKHLSLAEAVALCARHDIPAIGLWRDRVAEAGLAEAAAAVRAADLQVSSLCRGGFFTRAAAEDPDGRRTARADNLAAIAEAAELGTDTLVLVCGGLVPGQRDLGLARRMIADAIGELVPAAQRLGVRLGIEALHPMYCADRCVISSLSEAVDLALRFPADVVGVVVDTYHVWWDARLMDEIARAGCWPADRQLPGVRLGPAAAAGHPARPRPPRGRGDRLRSHLGQRGGGRLRRLRRGGDLQRRGLGRAAGPDRGDRPRALRRSARRALTGAAITGRAQARAGAPLSYETR